MRKIEGINTIGLYTLIRREMERIMRISVQTLAAPLISAFLFIFIFGSVLGQKIDLIAGIPYLQFVFPGILIMNVLSSAFEHTSSSVYFGIWIRSIEEMVVAPFSYIEMVLGYVLSAVIRSLIVGIGVLIIGFLFGAVQIASPLLFFAYLIGIATIFALLGILVGLWAKGFEQLGLLNTFVITPLTFLGGMFYSIELLPEVVKTITIFNPFFYFIDSMRYATLGFNESNLVIGAVLMIGLIIVFGGLVLHLFKIGWKIRN